MPISRNLVSAPLADLRRLSLLAALAAADHDVNPEMFVHELKDVFQGLPECLDGDVQALHDEGLVLLDDSIAQTKDVTVTNDGRTLVQRLQASIESNRDARVAVVAAMVLCYVHTHEDQASSTTTESLQKAEITVFGSPLPDNCVEEALKELHDLEFLQGTKAYGTVILPSLTAEGREVLRSGRPVLLPDQNRGGTSSVFNTTINGGIQGQNVAVASQGDVYQEATTVTVDQAMADLRIAVDALYEALEGQDDLRDKIEELLGQFDEAEDRESKSRMARALSGLRRLAQKAASKGVDQAVTLAVTEAATPLLKAIGS